MNKRWKAEMKLGLERIKALLVELGNPQRGMRSIHVAGTNGKGSTVSSVASVLAMSGLKVGVYTSPFIERFTDRIRILDGPNAVVARYRDSTVGEISELEVASLFTEILAASDRILAAGGEEASEFEVLTAAAFLHFKRQACEVVVLETGLGGRLDATNAIDWADIVIITALGFDHCDILGKSMAEIAAEKAAIIKPGTKQVLLYDPLLATGNEADAASVYAVVKARCEHFSVPLRVVKASEITPVEHGLNGQSFYLSGLSDLFFTPLLGDFQRMNCAMAIRSLLAFEPSLLAAPALFEGLRLTRWPGRLEFMEKEVSLLLDGAHNPQAAVALVKSMQAIRPERPLVLLLGVLRDKDYPELLRILHEGLSERVLAVVCSQPGVARDLSASELSAEVTKIWTDKTPLVIIEQASARQALKEAMRLALERQAMVLACGSLYLISDLRQAALPEKL